jgi:hypothetical protein
MPSTRSFSTIGQHPASRGHNELVTDDVHRTVSVTLYNGFDQDNLRFVVTDFIHGFIHDIGLTTIYHNSRGPGRGISCYVN